MRYLLSFSPRIFQRQVCVLLFIIFIITFVLRCMLPNNHNQNDCKEAKKEVTFIDLCSAKNFNFEEIIPVLRLGRTRFDNKRLIRIYDFHFTGNDWEFLVNDYNVCFATQASIERIHWLPYVLQKWAGPLSLALYITCEEEWLIFNLYMCYLSSCYSNYLNQIAIHIAVPINSSRILKIDKSIFNQWKDTNNKKILNLSKNCPKPKEYLDYLLKSVPTTNKEKLQLKEIYPQNHMRNIARKSCGTDWTFSADIDIIPREGSADLLQQFYDKMKKSPCEKCAFVIPTFELSESHLFPESKQDLINRFNEGSARQFHGNLYAQGHMATDYKKWISTNIEDTLVTISHPILTDKLLDYEPFYISSDVIPPFDERILGYGFTRNSQFKAAYIAGWNFTVVTALFSIHWGLQTNDNIIYPKKNGVGKNVRKEQTSKNYKIFTKIVKELELKKELNIF